MKTTSIMLISIFASVGAAVAEPLPTFDTSGGASYRPTLPPAPISAETRENILDADAHARQTYETVIDNGGCNADFIPYDIAAGCWAIANHGTEGEAVGASHD